MNEKQLIIAIICLVVSMGFAAFCIYLLAANPAPMTGYISNKTYHPEYFPVNHDTPWVYCLGITTDDDRRSTTWVVDAETYFSYNEGDRVIRLWSR